MSQKRSSPGLIIVVSAPSGGGKTTVRDRILHDIANLNYSVSCTTRLPRPGEISGKDYSFVDESLFLRMKEEGAFLEWAKVYDYYYGTPAKLVDTLTQAGKDVLMDIDTQGAMQVIEKRPAVLIFILPPSLDVLKKRLQGRATDSEAEIAKRLALANDELSQVSKYHYAVINDKIEDTLQKIKAIIMAERLKVERQQELVQGFKKIR